MSIIRDDKFYAFLSDAQNILTPATTSTHVMEKIENEINILEIDDLENDWTQGPPLSQEILAKPKLGVRYITGILSFDGPHWEYTPLPENPNLSNCDVCDRCERSFAEYYRFAACFCRDGGGDLIVAFCSECKHLY